MNHKINVWVGLTIFAGIGENACVNEPSGKRPLKEAIIGTWVPQGLDVFDSNGTLKEVHRPGDSGYSPDSSSYFRDGTIQQRYSIGSDTIIFSSYKIVGDSLKIEPDSLVDSKGWSATYESTTRQFIGLSETFYDFTWGLPIHFRILSEVDAEITIPSIGKARVTVKGKSKKISGSPIQFYKPQK